MEKNMGSFQFECLDPAVRRCMVRELDYDQAGGSLYLSSRLTGTGTEAWPGLLREAISARDEAWLAEQLRSGGYLRTHEERRKPKGGVTLAAVPFTAADTLAEGEFNRFYCRGVCLYIVGLGELDVEVYRGKSVQIPRPESVAMSGRRIVASSLLRDLRDRPGVEPALGLPPGPNSGLTVRRCRSVTSSQGGLSAR